MSYIFLDSTHEMTEILRGSAKKQLDSYADPWILMFELLQNALDAVEVGNPPEKKVSLSIDPARNTVIVSDNGVGFPAETSFFALGKGTKGNLNNPLIKGEHGVGMKMVILCSEVFEIWTRHAGQIWKAKFTDGWRFLENAERDEITERAEDSIIPPEFTTTVRVKFPRGVPDLIRAIDARGILGEVLAPYQNAEPHSYFSRRNRCELYLEHYFRTSCYTGDVNRLFDDKPAATLDVLVLKDDTLPAADLETTYPPFLREYWGHPRHIIFPASYWDPLKWYPEPERKGIRTARQLAAFNPATPTPDHLWVLKLTKKEDFLRLLDNPHIRSNYTDTFFERLLTEQIRGIFVVIGSAANNAKYNINSVMITKPDQVIAADGVVTTNQLRAPRRGKNQNYLNNIHIIVNINDRVNYGKQGVKNPALLAKLYAFFEEAYVKKLVDLASSVAGKRGDGNEPQPAPTMDIIAYQDLDEAELSIKKVPVLENTLIALTHELIARGRIKGISTYQLSSIDKYDCRGTLMYNGQRPFTPTRDDDLVNIEYKVKIMDLISDLELGNKDISEMDLAIVWDDTLDSGVTNYHYLDLENSTYEKLAVSEVRKVLRNVATGGEVPLLVLKEFVHVKQE